MNAIWSPGDPALPALYLGHGAPPLLEDPVWSGELRELAGRLPRPRAILIVSAHWEAAPLMLSASGPGAELVYDFAGFDPAYYRMRYDTPPAEEFAARVVASLPSTAGVHRHPRRGLDHGAWVPLKIMYPEADIPVLQLSLPTQDPGQLLVLGARLRELRQEGVLVVGSGFLTHGLPFLREFRIDATAPGWSSDFDAWAADALARADLDELASFQTKAPGMPYAHPTVEHYTPLFVALGSASDPGAPPEQIIDGFWMGLSKRSLLIA